MTSKMWNQVGDANGSQGDFSEKQTPEARKGSLFAKVSSAGENGEFDTPSWGDNRRSPPGNPQSENAESESNYLSKLTCKDANNINNQSELYDQKQAQFVVEKNPGNNLKPESIPNSGMVTGEVLVEDQEMSSSQETLPLPAKKGM